MQILFLPKWYPNKNGLLDGIFVRRHAEAVAQYENVTVLHATTDFSKSKKLFFFEEKTVNKNLTELIYYYKKEITGIVLLDRIIKMSLYFLCMYKGFVRIKNSSRKPDISHVHVPLRTDLFALFLHYFENIPFVHTEHWSGYLPEDGSYKGWIQKTLTKFSISKAKYIMPVTQHLANAMQQHGIVGNYQIVSNVVRTDKFILGDDNIVNQKKIALHISNFDPKAKNMEGILHVVAEISKTRNDFELWIVGYSSAIETLKTLAEELDILNKEVFFLGKKVDQELIGIIQKSDFLFMFSNYESQPCVIMEAMSCGKPILSSSVGGIPEMLGTTRGLLSEPKNTEMMIVKMNEMLDNLFNFDSIKIRQFAIEHFSYANVGNQIVHVYKKSLGLC